MSNNSESCSNKYDNLYKMRVAPSSNAGVRLTLPVVKPVFFFFNQFRFQRNYPPTPLLIIISQHFALSDKYKC